MNLIDYTNNPLLGDLSSHVTNDGSLSLRNNYYQESFHSCTGARKESLEKFIFPAQLNRFTFKKKLHVLDVCFGLGYNAGCLLEELIQTPINLIWKGLEIDKRPIKEALKNKIFRQSWSPLVLDILESINHSGEWENAASEGKILWGDARKTLNRIPNSLKFDLILHDAFSPTKCPQLWSEEFLHSLVMRLAPDGRLITYSSAAAIRGSLKRAGMAVYSTLPINENQRRWSIGTTAILSKSTETKQNLSPHWKALTQMEQEHLITIAAIPFRDPQRNGTTKEILNRRIKEQKTSKLISTSSWRKRWKNFQSS